MKRSACVARAIRASLTALMLAGWIAPTAAAEPAYEGFKKCASCHKSQSLSWRKTGHAKALDLLKPGARAEAKRRAKLDPAKDYSKDKDCLGCHVTGLGKEGGYDPSDPEVYLTGVGCESCHGPGARYQSLHREAAERFDKNKATTPRQTLADAGEDFEFAERCNACHLNYRGSPWKGAKAPYNPFTPQLDAKYRFDFDKSVRDAKAMHEHYKLDGVFAGPPLPPFHQEFQAGAKPIGKDERQR